jgi:anthranilate synthase component I
LAPLVTPLRRAVFTGKSSKVMNYPSEQEFLKLSAKGNLIPIYREILGDLETPVSTYYKIAAQADYSFLLESVEGEEKIARYSFLAKDPDLVVRSKDQQIEIIRFKTGKSHSEIHKITGSPLDFIRAIISKYRFVKTSGLPRFCGGLVGYIGYDTVRFFERLPNKPPDDLKLPDVYLLLAKQLVIFDHRTHTIKIVQCVALGEKKSLSEKRQSYRLALQRIDQLEREIRQPTPAQRTTTAIKPRPTPVYSNFTAKQFSNIVRKAKQEIHRGEIIQVVLSQRFTVPLKINAFQIYRTLRALNPSPYMYFLNFKGLQIVGSSPELLVRCEDGIVETRPIAGTRPRGIDDKDDARLIQDLLDDPKEKAEHIMLVDLGRNDLGRVCERGSVKVTDFMSIERYSHVLHIVSNVRGKLQKGKDAFAVLQAAFPAGTVSGAPKIRAMEIIDHLETVSRGPYAGCVGYISFSGNLDTCITIRTILVCNGKAYIQAGAGIVADSVPSKEYIETKNKARAQILAIQKACTLFSGI